MPEYKLIYFNAKGTAELIRWIFTHGGITFTDERIEMEDWPERKSEMPHGKVPVLMIDEEPLVQSLAIARFAAKEAGLVPEDNLEAAMCDALVDTVNEMMKELYDNVRKYDDDDEKQKYFEEIFFPNHLEPFLKNLNERLSEKEWFVTDQLTWADLMLARTMMQITEKHPDCLENFSDVAAHMERVCEVPSIKEWIENSPETAF
ncbi:hypothetical protein SK128_005166 [Halocaridina rubra]|uniref:glutathione transferase n=1 Tax=Halocaridina rubra TaxID=373956 RepID=A0AAN8WKR9_HALRR